MPGYIALNGADLSAAKGRLAAVKAGTARMVVAHVGDSTTHGYQNNGSDGNRTGTAANAYPAQLAAKSMASLGVPGLANAFIGASDETIGYLPTYEPRFAYSGLVTETSGQASNSLGGNCFTATTSGFYYQFTPTGTVDTVDVYFLTDSGAGSMDVSFAGSGALAKANGNQAQALRRLTVPLTRGTGAIRLTKDAAGGNGYFCGVDAYDSTIKGVSHLNLGWGGAKAADLAFSTYGYSYLPGVKAVAPHVAFINVGINDWTAGTSVTAFKASVQAIIDGVKLSGLPVLMTSFPSDLSQASQAAQDAIVQAVKDLGVLNSVPVIDNRARFVSYTQAVSDGRANDFYKLHPNTTGYALMADSADAFLKLLA